MLRSLFSTLSIPRRQARNRAVARLQRINDALIAAERALTDDRGLRGRQWYKHQIYAPGMYTGYGVKTLPGVREAAEAKNWDEANQEVASVAEVLSEMDRRIQEATRLLSV